MKSNIYDSSGEDDVICDLADVNNNNTVCPAESETNDASDVVSLDLIIEYWISIEILVFKVLVLEREAVLLSLHPLLIIEKQVRTLTIIKQSNKHSFVFK